MNSPITLKSTIATLIVLIGAVTYPASAQTGLRFVPVTPCRIADTRNANGPFGGPYMQANTTRDFAVPGSACNIPALAQAYALNVTVVPKGDLQYVSVWPAGQTQPTVSTLNSFDGRIKANAAIVPAGNHGAISVFVTDDTHLILDINGYFIPDANDATLAFYPVTPCRVADTRGSGGPLGGPFLTGGTNRDFPILSSACNLPPQAQAYSLNFTAVPRGALGYLTTWPAGQDQPVVSTLNSPTGAVTANAAIVPAGDKGAISVFASNDSDLVIDINGYFAPPAAGGLSLYNLPPCRVLDTRNGSPSTLLSGTLTAQMASGNYCNVPATAQAYVLNATVVPQGSLSWLTLWPHGQSQPVVSTLNALDGQITSNMALVPAGASNSVDAYATNPTHLILDTSGYFAPSIPRFSVNFNPSSLVWGTQATGSVTLNAPAPNGGAVVRLSASSASGHSFFYSMPDSVVVPAGAMKANFTVTTTEIYTTEQLQVTASYNGMSQATTLTVDIPRVISVKLSPDTVSAGNSTTATVTLNGPPPTSVTVLVRLQGPVQLAQLSTNTLTIPAGQSKAQFTITTSIVPEPVQVTVIAVAEQGATPEVSAALTINLTTRGRTWMLKNVTFNDGGTASGYFTYDAATGTYLDLNIKTTKGSDPGVPLGIAYSYPNPNPPLYITALDNHSSPSVLETTDTLTDEYRIKVGQQIGVLGFIFARPLTNAGGEIPLVVDPQANFKPFCTWEATCQYPPSNISQEWYHMPSSNPPGLWIRTVTGGSIVAQ